MDRKRFLEAIHQALKEHDRTRRRRDATAECVNGHTVRFLNCDKELEDFADRILELVGEGKSRES